MHYHITVNGETACQTAYLPSPCTYANMADANLGYIAYRKAYPNAVINVVDGDCPTYAAEEEAYDAEMVAELEAATGYEVTHSHGKTGTIGPIIKYTGLVVTIVGWYVDGYGTYAVLAGYHDAREQELVIVNPSKLEVDGGWESIAPAWVRKR